MTTHPRRFASIRRSVRGGAIRAACVAALIALASPWAAAGLFSVSPVRIYMTPSDRAIAVTLTNEGNAEVALQADLYTWAQKPDGSDDLVLTEDLIVAPPIVRLAPGARQVVRLARLVPPDLARQLTYRLIMREVPEVTAPKVDKGMVLQLPIALAMSMPVFITPPAARRDVQCQLAPIDPQSFSALCQNVGTAYAQVRQVLLLRGEQELARFEGGTYILPGARRTMSLKADKPVAAGPALARFVFDDGKTTELPVRVP
ncbi:MAG TPA: fimbria/pilus periplasmic chaperone [Ramlibacter sp.]|nr:fimbria/pilus periplasmic chaperone [Ramlibacter sp.]